MNIIITLKILVYLNKWMIILIRIILITPIIIIHIK